MNKFYTGIGSRETPKDFLLVIHKIALHLADKGYILRSGGADGADKAFEEGCFSAGGSQEIYLPWKGFNGNPSPLFKVTKEALELAAKIHPSWSKLRQGARKLHARNCYQCIGYDLKTPSDLLICWTKGGAKIGGTRTAVVLAEQYNIPVYNLAIEGKEEELYDFIEHENL